MNETTREHWEIVLSFEATQDEAAEVGRRVTRILSNAGVSLRPTANAVCIMEDQNDR